MMDAVERATEDEAFAFLIGHSDVADQDMEGWQEHLAIIQDALTAQRARIAALEAENSSLRIHVAALKADADDDYRDLLKAILDIEHECETIGGGPGWQERRKKAYREAWERFE